jgi:hypothetical protein
MPAAAAAGDASQDHASRSVPGGIDGFAYLAGAAENRAA